MKDLIVKEWNAPFIEFLSGRNTIAIRNENEFEILKELCLRVGLQVKPNKWETWQSLVKIDQTISDKPSTTLYFEFENSKGFSFYYQEKDSINWHEIPPLTLEDIFQQN